MATSNIDKQSFGQAGATFISTTGVVTGQFCAITMLADTKFETLTWAELNKSRGGSDWLPTTAGDAMTGGDAIANTNVFPAGVTIYGEFSAIEIVAEGIVLAYHAA